ncbi:MAG: uroporphyrinogen-III C-methyltransferase [Megasphaera sp.]|jgi:uroporphyrinogen III methyltransferase/synthase|nr:uroporphyrinogen-III C-methyltransferase [Megasphaera sp.]MCH4188139.1 uroporphyrinogen-III C-methyltransferase [Megasphaera sp.]MCH4217977.1 uroporphyrinogen-III C-methyltransferase [Megasphaera sp.]
MTGIVYLVGAGPGDYRLLTLRGKEVLEQADVVVYDHLADDRLLAFAPDSASFIYVGKTASHHTYAQEDINTILINKAAAGNTVVRLKGGDPFVFGRGGEEIRALAAQDIPFEVVPGITSAIAAPAYAGIPVTDRTAASSFAVITGHENPSKKSSAIHWDTLATAVDTLVFLMGIHNLPFITEQLIAHGRAGNTPAALIRWGTKTEQKTVVTTVANAAADARRYSITPPAVFIVGEVVALRKQQRWFDIKPLFNQTILITRTRSQASVLTNCLENLGAHCIEVPTIRIANASDDYRHLDKAIQSIAEYDWIVFTSVNGVHAFFCRLALQHKDSRALGHASIAVIGTATAAALTRYGITADIIPERYDAENLAAALLPHIQKGTTILLPRAKESRDLLPDALRQRQAIVHTCEAYETIPALENRATLIAHLQQRQVSLITFTSSSTVINFMTLLGPRKELLQGITFACIGPITARTAESYGLSPCITADVYTIPGLVEKIKDWSIHHDLP